MVISVSATATFETEKIKNTPGKLCIFFGYHLLAGQTDAMLFEASKESLNGKTVLGCINNSSPHAEQHFSNFLSSALCRNKDECSDAIFDIDEVLRQRPDLFFTEDRKSVV